MAEINCNTCPATDCQHCDKGVKMCPIWQHECYNEKCQAWRDDRCEILFVMSLPNTSWCVPVCPDPTKLKFWESPFTCSGSERITR